MIDFTMNEARERNHPIVDTEDLLLAIAAQVLTHHADVTLENARAETVRLTTRSNE